MLDTLVNGWLLITLLVTLYYALFSYFATSRALRSFSGTDRSFEVSTKQSIKRLGIVYAFWVLDGAVLFYIIQTDSSWSKSIQCIMLLSNALYSFALCYLVSHSDFWASDALKKNLPFVFVNLVLFLAVVM